MSNWASQRMFIPKHVMSDKMHPEIMSGRQSFTMTSGGHLFINTQTISQDFTVDFIKDLRAQPFHLDLSCKKFLVDQHQLYTINTGLSLTNRTWTSLKYNLNINQKPLSSWLHPYTKRIQYLPCTFIYNLQGYIP